MILWPHCHCVSLFSPARVEVTVAGSVDHLGGRLCLSQRTSPILCSPWPRTSRSRRGWALCTQVNSEGARTPADSRAGTPVLPGSALECVLRRQRDGSDTRGSPANAPRCPCAAGFTPRSSFLPSHSGPTLTARIWNAQNQVKCSLSAVLVFTAPVTPIVTKCPGRAGGLSCFAGVCLGEKPPTATPLPCPLETRHRGGMASRLPVPRPRQLEHFSEQAGAFVRSRSGEHVPGSPRPAAGSGLTAPRCQGQGPRISGTRAPNPPGGAEGAGITLSKYRALGAFPGNRCFHGKCWLSASRSFLQRFAELRRCLRLVLHGGRQPHQIC